MTDDPRSEQGAGRGYASPGDDTRSMPAHSSRPAQQEGYLPLPPELSPRKKSRSGPWRGKQAPAQPGGPGQPGDPGKPGYPGQPGAPGGQLRRPRRFGWGKRLLALLVVLIVVVVGLLVYWDGKLTRVRALGGYDGRPTSAGTNWLLVGADSRAGLSDAEKKALATGSAAGSRTDTIMLVHTGSAGTTLISLPRDSYVPIPGHGRNKLNAAFSLGGAPLLTRTVEEATGLRIDHFAQIGFGGFANMVNAVGGVRLCVDKPIDDPKAGLNLAAGCQKLDGAQALGYVRTRATANADLDRVQHQRTFLAALVSQSARPTVLLNPFRSIPLGSNAVDSLTVDRGTHVWSVARLGLALRGLSGGKGATATVPIGSTGPVSGIGDVVFWDHANALRLFDALGHDKAVPADLIKK
jgi:LCP family protein required for cell wall assembly